MIPTQVIYDPGVIIWGGSYFFLIISLLLQVSVSYVGPWWFVILAFSIFLANPFTTIRSKIASIAPGTNSMRLAAGWDSPSPPQRGLHTLLLDILKVAWLPCLLFQTLPPSTSRMSARSPYSGPHRKLVLAFDVGTTFSGISYWQVYL